MDEYFCPNCGAILNDQLGFDPDAGTWTCTECGTHLMDDDVYEGDSFEGVAWYCDNCGALLNRQAGFSDTCGTWTCTECYHSNPINDDDEYSEGENGASFGESLGSIVGDFTNAMYAKMQAEEAETRHEREVERRKDKQRRRAWRKAHKKGLRIFYLVLILIVVISIGYYEGKQLTQVGISSNEMIGDDYTTVMNALKQKGFKYVSVEPIGDLVTGEEDELNKIEGVKIGFIEDFSENIKIPANIPVKITYHTYLTIGTPYSSKEAKKQSYEEVQEAFKTKGFTNIKLEVEYDIVTGWMTKEGDIEKITIDENDKFDSNEEFRPDSEVVITYHDWKKNKPKE